MLTDDKNRKLELFFLEAVQEGLALDIAAVERGGVPRKWEGGAPPSLEELEQLRAYHRQAGEAIAHVRACWAWISKPAGCICSRIGVVSSSPPGCRAARPWEACRRRAWVARPA